MVCPKCDKVVAQDKVVCSECALKLAEDKATENVDKFKLGHREGYRKAIVDYAYWKGGEKYVGFNPARKLKDVLAELDSKND